MQGVANPVPAVVDRLEDVGLVFGDALAQLQLLDLLLDLFLALLFYVSFALTLPEIN